MRTASFLALALALSCFCSGRTAAQPAGKEKTPLERYALFRQTMIEGKYDIAAIYLEEFLKNGPTDADLLQLEKQYGTTVFQQLRAVPRYSDNPAVEKRTREVIEELNARAKEAVTKLLYNKDRVQKYVNNLGATYEEKVFAQQELKRTGDFAVPFLVEEIRRNPTPELYAGILDTIPVLEGHTMAGWVAALDALAVDRQYGVLVAMASRRDVFNLLNNAQTDFTPHLWRILAADPKAVPKNLRELALNLLNQFYPGIKADTKRPEVELVAISKRFYEHKARYLDQKGSPAGAPATVPMWVTTSKDGLLDLTRLPEVPMGQADEYFGLRYARWALASKPEYEPAQALILALAAERAVDRSKYGHLAATEPAAYTLLAEAPSRVLNELLARGLKENRTPLVLAMVQVLGDRADRDAATPPHGPTPKPSLFVRALSYPNPAVQFAAASALLRSPVPVPLDSRRAIVDILRRAAATDPGAPGESKGTVLMADPVKFRAGANGLLLRGFGYSVEYFASGREVLRRIAKSSDFDMIVIDRHTANPELIDLISQLDTDPRTANRPTFVIASSDRPRLPTFDQLLVRMAALIAATENDVVAMPPPYTPDLRFTVGERTEEKVKTQNRRDDTFRAAAQNRVARLQRVLDTLDLSLTASQRLLMSLRMQLIAYTMLGIDFPFTADSAPATVAEVERIRKQLAAQPASAEYKPDTAALDLIKLIERFELDVAKVPAAQARFEQLLTGIDPVELGLNVETYRDRELEAKLAHKLQNYPAVKILPEPYSRQNLATGLAILFADPMIAPRSQEVKQAEARQAVDYLRRMATGDIPGFDVKELKSAEPELIAALQHFDPDVVSAAIDAVERFKSAAAQAALLQVATTSEKLRPSWTLAVRKKAADAAIRHVRENGKAATDEQIARIAKLADANGPEGEPDAVLRGKFLTLKGMLAYNPAAFAKQLEDYTPPILPPQEPKKDPEPKVEPEKKEP